MGALSNSPMRKLNEARTSASLSLRVITKTIIVSKSPHLTASFRKAFRHPESRSCATRWASGGATDTGSCWKFCARSS
jgi:hypothetical protein